MNDLFADIGYRSMNKYGEELCGDHIDIMEAEDGSLIIVLADGMGSGVRASILSTLTAKIISTMIANGMNIEDCVETVAATLPLSPELGVAYSTFTILRIDNRNAEIIQYDNPDVILLRNGANMELHKSIVEIGGKAVSHARVELQENDIFIAMSDGCLYAGTEAELNRNWERKDIISFMETFSDIGFTAKTLNTILLDECYKLYGGQPSDDTTACTVRIIKREPMNLIIGPPLHREDCSKMMSLFFSKEGKHIVCGGTTASIAAEFLGKKVVPNLDITDPAVPPTSEIEGVDLVTEGVLTISKVLEYAKDYLEDNESYKNWSYKKDGASKIARLLFEEATDINFYVGRAINPAHQTTDIPIGFNKKMQLINELAGCLRKMGKKIKVSYF